MEKFFYDENGNKINLTSKDYWEDLDLSVGFEQSTCVDCDKVFWGYKGRLICKDCKNCYPGG